MNTNEHFKVTTIIFFSLAGAQAVYFLIASGIAPLLQEYSREMENILKYGLAFLIIIEFFLARYLYFGNVRKARELDFQNKLNSYRVNNIIKWAMIESIITISITFYLITGSMLFAITFLIAFLIFLFNYPSKNKFAVEYELTPEEIMKLN